MTLATVEMPPPAVDLDRNRLLDQQHLAITGASWSLYEKFLEETADRRFYITFDRGNLEIMSPLYEHEVGKKSLARLLEFLAFELNVPLIGYGSSTHRREDKQVGLEPDECYYANASAAAAIGIKRWDPDVHAPPDLAIEVDITARSVPRQPIYARLGVPELWRYDGRHLTVLLLDAASLTYKPSTTSASFPFLPMAKFEEFLHRMEREDHLPVLRDVQAWARTLAAGQPPVR